MPLAIRMASAPLDQLKERAASDTLCRTCRHSEVCTTASTLAKLSSWALALSTCAYYDEDARLLTDEDHQLALL